MKIAIYTDDGKGGKQDGKRYDGRHSRKIIFNFTMPIFIGNIFQQFYNMVRYGDRREICREWTATWRR